jgi:hypothetical protein
MTENVMPPTSTTIVLHPDNTLLTRPNIAGSWRDVSDVGQVTDPGSIGF